MLTEINKDFYCSAGFYDGINYCLAIKGACGKLCNAYHRKWPTPKQFEEEYGFEYPDDGAVYYCNDRLNDPVSWRLGKYGKIKKLNDGIYMYESGIACTPYYGSEAKERLEESKRINGFFIAVCLCTPWGKPPADWRPE